MKSKILVIICILLTVSSILTVGGCRPTQPDEQSSQRTAKNFLLDGPTFKFDGITDTLKLVSTDTLKSPYSWEFFFEFECSHSGYGERSGQSLLQVITPHTALVRVIEGKVVEAIIDNKWDELEQELLETPPSPVPAAPNDSIVTATVVTTPKQNQGSMWEVMIAIQNSEDVPGYLNATKEKTGHQMIVLSSEDISHLVPGKLITAHVKLKGDENTRYYYASEFHLV